MDTLGYLVTVSLISIIRYSQTTLAGEDLLVSTSHERAATFGGWHVGRDQAWNAGVRDFRTSCVCVVVINSNFGALCGGGVDTCLEIWMEPQAVGVIVESWCVWT